ncbi:unnamed protein product [Dovyalis caffra]|uniref:Uncharacterized protein n=1 Tax=Dovyalis caffra TaxID=77055 RepID=A0AAV1SC84_9ROSI|nr:unnamed protein product [Dovyalis caffra]
MRSIHEIGKGGESRAKERGIWGPLSDIQLAIGVAHQHPHKHILDRSLICLNELDRFSILLMGLDCHRILESNHKERPVAKLYGCDYEHHNSLLSSHHFKAIALHDWKNVVNDRCVGKRHRRMGEGVWLGLK